jgi:hypothetical protein
VRESCVPGIREDCARAGCLGSDTWVHFEDLGAGTTALIATDSCLVPGINGVRGGGGSGPVQPDLEPCDFSDPELALPLLCECGCE